MEEIKAVESAEVTAFIVECNSKSLVDSVNKMNRKAVKLGCEPIGIVFTGKVDYRSVDNDPRNPNKIKYVEVTLIGKSPVLSGWTLVSCVDHDPMIGQTFRTAPNKEVPAQYMAGSTYCDHCQSDRKRNKTYIVENVETGEFKRIGSTCVKSFLGDKSAEMFLFYASYVSFVESIDEEFGRGGHETRYFDLDYILALTVKIVSEVGYVSAAKMNESIEPIMSTAMEVQWQLNPKNTKPYIPTKEEIEATSTMIEWAKKLNENENSYLYNLVRIAEAGMVNDKLMGFAVSIIPAYNRAMDLLRESERKAPSEYYGTVGDKVALELIYTRSFGYDSNYGYVHIHKFEDANGNQFSWNTQNAIEMASGTLFKIRGTIKAHSEYKGYKSTVLTRCKLDPDPTK